MDKNKPTVDKSAAELLSEAREFTDEVRQTLIDRLDANTISPRAKIPHKARILREVLLQRARGVGHDPECREFEPVRPEQDEPADLTLAGHLDRSAG
jgi:hypothetical protein